MGKIVNYNEQLKRAITVYWATRARQAENQVTAGNRDQGARGAVTGGAQMNGFTEVVVD